VYILSNWDGKEVNGVDRDIFRGKNKKGYRWAKNNYTFTTTNGDTHLVQFPKKTEGEDGNTWEFVERHLCHQENCFDILNEIHSDGHPKDSTMHNRVKLQWANISEEICRKLVSLCPVCSLQRGKARKVKGALKPIDSFKYRDRSQADLIDFRMDPSLLYPEDPTSPVCLWLLVVKDHFTRIVYLNPLRSKSAKGVSKALDYY
jgi:hypothetical protein